MRSYRNRCFEKVLLSVVVTLFMTACTGTTFEMEEPLDPADILGAAQYAVVVELADKSEIGPAKDQRQWTGTVSDVAWSAGQAWTGGEKVEVRTPSVGSSFTFAGSGRLELGQATVVVVVRDIVYQDDVMHLALLVLDEDWRPVAGTEPLLAAGIAAAVDAAGEASSLNSVVRVLDESVTFNDARNTDPGTKSEPKLVRAAREAAGIASGSSPEKASLEAWLATPAEARQLSSELDDMPPSADTELGVDWVWREAAIVPTAEFVANFDWVGLYFPDVGVIGPFALNDADEPTVIMGFGPAGSPVQLLAWVDKEAIPGEGETLATLDQWAGDKLEAEPEALWVTVAGSQDVGIEVVSRVEYEARVLDFSTLSEEAPETQAK